MAAQDQSPATKKDIRLLMEQMGKYYDQTDKNIGELRQDMTAWKKEIVHKFHIVAENIRHDLLKGARSMTRSSNTKIGSFASNSALG